VKQLMEFPQLCKHSSSSRHCWLRSMLWWTTTCPRNGKITTQHCHGYFGWFNDELSGVISYL
jgi:hypothetical protein